MNTSKFIGCVMIVVGSIVGAGMLAIPTVSAACGFTWSTILMLVIWLASTISGLLILEVNLAFPVYACTFNSMAKHTLGGLGKIITWVSYLFLLYAIITAYVIGASNIIASNVSPDFPTWASSILFTVILGAAVFWSTKTVDYFNRILLSFKGLFLVSTLVFLVPYINMGTLNAIPDLHQAKYLWLASPAILCAFCFHFVIPSIRIYIGDKSKQLKIIIIFGTTIALLIYLWWLAAALGTIPLTGDHGFTSIIHDKKSPSLLIEAVTFFTNNRRVSVSIQGFANIALTSSFLCVAIGLFDFLADGFKRSNNKLGRLQTAGLTFLPPLIFAIFFPQGFNKALTYASIPVATLSLILPTLMVYRLRKSKDFNSPYKVKCGNIAIALIFLIGVISIAIAILYILDLLPSLK